MSEQNDLPLDAPKDAPVDAPKDAPKDVKADAPKDVPKEAPKDTPKDVKADAPKDAPKDAPAVDYAKELKLPEGVQADEVFGEAVKLFGEMKLPAAAAQKLIDFTADRDRQMAKAVNDASAKAWTDQVGKWKEASSKEFSEDDLGGAKTALEQVFDKETVAYLEGLGFTNHPGVIRGMVKVSKAIKEDTFAPGNAARPNGSDARALYPNSNMNA